ncbi:MAG: hypothetical protein Q9168_006594 [Polycauliona sp. 1 TL-2023]
MSMSAESSSVQSAPSTYGQAPLYLIFSGNSSSRQTPALIYQSQEAAIEWCARQLQTQKFTSYTKDRNLNIERQRINPDHVWVEIEGTLKSTTTKVAYTINRCDPHAHMSEALRACPLKETTARKALWVLHCKSGPIWERIYRDEQDAEGWFEKEKKEDRQWMEDCIVSSVPIGDEFDEYGRQLTGA